MATDDELIKLYGELRSSLLSRHFAFGRYFRADHLALFNHLGTVHNNVQSQPSDDKSNKDDIEIKTRTRKLVKPTAYENTTKLQEQLKSAENATTRQAQKTLLERWRVGRFERENPLNLTGQLLTCLAVEYYLDLERPEARKRIMEVLETLASLCKFKDNHFDGYMIRWDPVTSDRWVTGDDNGKPDPRYCCEFLVGSNGRYLYSTPLDDPRYTPFMREYESKRGLKKEDKTQGQKAYEAARDHSLGFYRQWEPSQDELVGLVLGYDIVFRLVDDAETRGKVRDQVNNLGDYLAENGYLLVRPNGGFTARGASGFSVALEFPFGQVFKRITDDHYRPRVGFEGALGKAGLWESLQGPLMWGTIEGAAGGGIMTGLVLLASVGWWGMPLGLAGAGLLAGVLGSLGGLALSAGVGIIIGRAAAIYLHRNVFDVSGDEAQGEFTIAYLLKKWPSIKQRFQVAFWWLKSSGRHAAGFPPSIGLTGLDDNDQAVRNAYLDWFEGRRENGLEPFEKGLFGPLLNFDPISTEWITLLDNETIPEQLRQHFININRRLAATATVSKKNTGSRWWIQSGQQTYVIKKEGDTLIRIYGKGVEKLFAQAVAVILGAGPVEERNLAQLLQEKYDLYHAIWKDPDETKVMWKGDLTIRESYDTNYDTDDALPDEFTNVGASAIPVAIEDIMPDLDYMAALALTWLHTKRRVDAGTPIPSEIGFPTVPAPATNWPPATIPGYVYDAAQEGNIALPVQAIPPFDGEIRPDDIDVFGGADTPSKPKEDPRVKLKPESQKQLVDVRQWTVRESDSVVDTGADILPEDTISFSASGEIWSGVWLAGKNGPDGWNKTDHDQKFPLWRDDGARPYCLLAKIGHWGNWMFVGTQNEYRNPIDGQEGRLYLRINDDKPGNGSGEFLCRIEVKR